MNDYLRRPSALVPPPGLPLPSVPVTPPTLRPISSRKSEAIGVTTYVYEEAEAVIRQSGLVPDWVRYPAHSPGAGIAVPAHHVFPSYLKLLRLQSGRLRLEIDIRAVLGKDLDYREFIRSLLADTQLSLVKGERR